MRACEQGLRPSVRSTLMIGAAGAAVTFGAATAIADSNDAKPPPSINKYLPYAQIGGTSGDSMSTGGVTLFIPAWQALNQLLFVKVGGDVESSESNFSTFGLGYRQKIAPTWIVGVFGNYDHTHTKLNDDFSQFVFGAELLNPNWEFHANSYFADTSKIDLIKDSARLEVDGNDIAIVREQEAPYSGFDGSGGYRVFKTPGSDGRLYAGGFYFKASNEFDTKAIAGPKVGFEFNVYDLDFIGPQSRLQVQGEVRNDSVRGDSGFIGVNLRVPINIDPSGPGAQALDELDRRMVDDPQTQANVLTQSEFNKPEPVIIYGSGGGRTHPTNTIFYVDNSTGAGSYPDPTTFGDASTRAGANALIVLTTKDGAVTGQGNLSSGDMLIGAGTTLTVKGTETGYKFTHTFAPGEHDASVNVAAGATAITLAADNALYNFAITGSFGTAIAGNNVGVATIRNLTITGDGSEGQKGIAITQDSTSKLDFLMTDSAISNLGSDGISIATHVDGAGSSTQTIALSNVSISSVGGNGLVVSTQASGGAQITQDISLDKITVAGAGGIGIGIAGFAEGDGSQLTQTGEITDANVSGANSVGIGVYAYTSSGGTLNQNVSIDPTTVNTSGYALSIGADAVGGTLNQTVTVNDFTGSGNNNGVEIYAYGDAGAGVYQTAVLTNVSFDAVGHDGVRIFAHSTNGAYVNQGVGFNGLTLNGAGLYDIAVGAYADGGSIHQTAIFNNVTINGAAQSAIDIFAETGNGGEGSFRPLLSGGENGNYYSLIQDVMFNTASIDTSGDAFYAGVKASNGDSAAQYVSFSSDSSVSAYNGGVAIYANASGNSLIHQQIHLPQLTLNGSGGEGGFGSPARGDGILIDTHSYNGSTVNSYTLIDSASITYAFNAAVSLVAYAEGGDIGQTLKLNNANIASYNAAGIFVYGDAEGGATLNQNALLYNVAVSGSGNPLMASAKSRDSGHANQYISFTGDSALNSTEGGVVIYALGDNYGVTDQTVLPPDINIGGGPGISAAITAHSYYGGAVHQGVALGNVTVDNSGGGLFVDGTAASNGTTTQTVTVDNLTASGEVSGVYLRGVAADNAHLSQYLTVGTATLTDETGKAFYATLSATNGANALQSVSLSNADTDNSYKGIVADISAFGGVAEQDFTLGNISAQYELRSGIALYANSSGSATQRATIDAINAGHDGGDGLYLNANVTGGTVGQYVSVTDGTFDYDANGLHAYLTSTGGTTHQQLALTNTTADHNLDAGLRFFSNGDGPSYLYQSVIATNSHFDHNGGAGIVANNGIGGGANLHQGVGLYTSSADYNAGVGVGLYTIADNAHSAHNTVIVNSSGVSNNGANGIAMSMTSSYTFVAAQYFNAQGSTFNANSGDGVGLVSSSQADTISYQGITSANDTFSGNTGVGLRQTASDAPGEDSSTGIISQALSSSGDTFDTNSVGGIYQNIGGSAATYLLQSGMITGATVTGGSADGIFIGLDTASPNAIVYRTISNTTVSGSGGSGIHLISTAQTGGQIDETTSVTSTTVTGGGDDGLYIVASAESGGAVFQNLTLTNDTVTNLTGAGVYLYAVARGGTVIQHADIEGLTSTANSDGFLAGLKAIGPGAIAAQYLQISNSSVNANANVGAEFDVSAKYGGVDLQSVSITGLAANNNGFAGLEFLSSANNGSTANQYAHLDGISVVGNVADGIDIVGTATDRGFVAQTFVLTDNSDTGNIISYNGGDGIAVGANALNAGNVEQNVGIYNTDVSHNTGNGVLISGSASGSVAGSSATYYSHVAQNMNAYYDTFSLNGKNGVDISNVASGGAQINSFAYFYNDKFEKNAGDGLHVYSHANAGSNVYDDIYVVGGSASKNGGNGIAIDSYAYQSTYLIQNIAIIGVAVNNNGGGESGGNGFVDNAHARGQYSLNGQYITLANSTFDGNHGSGAVLEAAQTYGPGPFGVARQYLTIVGSDFSHNTQDGLYAITDAGGNQGRAEQHFTISGSKFDANNNDGIHLKNYITDGVLTYGTNSDGTYPLTCDQVQGADGGCAFVRQTVDIADSDISHNGSDGIYISTVLNHYAAAYNVGGRPLNTPTLYLNNVTVDHNGANGLHVSNSIADNSYEYQYIVAVNSHFDHNQGYGILVGSGVSSNSSLKEKIVLAGVTAAGLGGEGSGPLSSADHNGKGGIDIETVATDAGIVSNALVLAYTDVSGNGGSGVTMRMRSTDVNDAVQSFSGFHSTFANNSGDGITLYTHSYGDTQVAVQVAQSYYDTFSKNGGAGLNATALDNVVTIGDALHTTLVAAQSITSVGDRFTNNADGGIFETADFEAPIVAYQKLYVSGDMFTASRSGDSSPDQINSNFRSGSPNGAVYRTVQNSSFAGGEGNAIDFSTAATGVTIDQTVISGNAIKDAGGDGIKIAGAGYNYGTLHQQITMNGDHVYNSRNDGVLITGNASAAGKVVQIADVTGLISRGNGGDGFSLYGNATGANSILAQYATITGSTFTHNGGAGVSLFVEGNDALAVATQQTSIAGSTFKQNGIGIEAQARAFAGASANQYTLLTGDTVDHNIGDGIRILSYAETQGFVAQGLNFKGTANAPVSISHNGSDGIYISARAINGGEIEQNVGVYFANIARNAGDGIDINTYASGSMAGYAPGHDYYSHITQNIGVGYGSITHNGGDGMRVVNFAGPGTGLNQYMGVYYENISSNTGKGISEHSVAEAYVAPHIAQETYLYSDLYVIGGNVTKNGTGGIDLRSYADGTTYMIQHIVAQGVHVDGNHGDGFNVTGSARGLYSLNIQYITLAASTFDHNTGNGARVYGHQFYGGYGSFGAVLQYVTAQQSDFSHNRGNGLEVDALATDEQGRVGQTITITGSTFDNNTGDGIHLSRTASAGTYLDGYSCTAVQGLYGGCAFVRQTVQIANSDISHNKGDGLYIGTNASNYGTVYSTSGRPKHTPTVVIYDTTIDYNGGDGLHLVNNASGGSDIYQYVVAVDSHFDHNAGYGIEAHNSVTGGSTLFQSIVLYHYVQRDRDDAGPLPTMTVGYNGKGGVHIDAYAGTGSTVYEGLTLIGTDVGHNTGDGVNVSLNANGALKATQTVHAAYSTFVGNTGDGIHVTAYGLNGSNLTQSVTSLHDFFSGNGGAGLSVGFKENGVAHATQKVVSYSDSFQNNGSGLYAGAEFIGGSAKRASTILVRGDVVQGGADGIDIVLAASNGARVSGFQRIAYSSFNNVTGDGIDISLTSDTNAKWSDTAQILGNSVQYAGADGIAVNFALTNGAHLGSNPLYKTAGLVIQGNTILGQGSNLGGGDGIYVGFTVGSGGSIFDPGGERGVRPFVAQIDNNKISYVNGEGIDVVTNNTGGVLDESSLIYGNSVYYAALGGIAVSHKASGGQTNVFESIHDNHVYANNFSGGEGGEGGGERGGNEAGILVTATGTGGNLFDRASIYANTTEGHDIGVAVEASGDQGTRQFASIHDNHIYQNATGIYGLANGGGAYQYISYASNSMSSNGGNYDFTYAPGSTQVLN